MQAFLAWLPFLVAIVLAFAAGVVFSRINERLTTAAEEPPRGGVYRLIRGDVALMAALGALLVAVLVVWAAAVVHIVR